MLNNLQGPRLFLSVVKDSYCVLFLFSPPKPPLHIVKGGNVGFQAVKFYPWLCHCLSRWSVRSHRTLCSLSSLIWDQCSPNLWQTLRTFIQLQLSSSLTWDLKLLMRNTFFTLWKIFEGQILIAMCTQVLKHFFCTCWGSFKLSHYHAYLTYTAGINFDTMIQALTWYELKFIHSTLTDFPYLITPFSNLYLMTLCRFNLLQTSFASFVLLSGKWRCSKVCCLICTAVVEEFFPD